MQYSKTLELTPDQANEIINCLSGATPLYEGETITYTTKFDNGMQMDIKCCGAEMEYGGPWTEAVLFNQAGGQVAFTEPDEDIEGPWELEYKGDQYITDVIVQR